MLEFLIFAGVLGALAFVIVQINQSRRARPAPTSNSSDEHISDDPRPRPDREENDRSLG